MAQLIVRNLDASIKAALKERAALRGISMESEAREILTRALQRRSPRRRGLGSAIRARFAKVDPGIELAAPPAGAVRAAELPD